MHQAINTKTLLFTLAIFVLMIDTAKKAFKKMFSIYYLILFKNIEIQALLNLRDKVNIITSFFADKLGFSIQKINARI